MQMKRVYEKPAMQWVVMQSNEAIADVCWAYAQNGKDFYHDIPGVGHAILTIVDSSGCDNQATFVYEFSNAHLTATERASAQSYMEQVIAEAKAKAGNKASNYKGSPFVAKPDYSWS